MLKNEINLEKIKTRYLILGLVISILVFVGLIGILKNGSVKYITKELSKGTITEYVEASGTIKPINTLNLYQILYNLFHGHIQ